MSQVHAFPEDASFEEIRQTLQTLNADPSVHGILVQLPLPASLNTLALTDLIHPDKDVDGVTLSHQGALFRGQPDVIPCTPLGCLWLLRQVYEDLKGLNIGIVGRSLIVGRPLASLLTLHDAIVTLAHSYTRSLDQVLQRMDVVVAATGSPGLIQRPHIREGATVIDVGIHRVQVDGRTRLVGDVDRAAVQPWVHAITPVPGGVGPMTVACLLYNTTRQTARALGIETSSLEPHFTAYKG